MLEDFQMNVNMNLPSATVKLVRNHQEAVVSEAGNGAISALYAAILKAVDMPIHLIDYRIQNIGAEKESLGKVVVQIQYDGKFYFGKAIERDVMKASALALVNSVNKIVLNS